MAAVKGWVFTKRRHNRLSPRFPLKLRNTCRLSYRGVEGARGTQFPGRRITTGPPKCHNHVTSTFFSGVHLLPKDLRFKH